MKTDDGGLRPGKHRSELAAVFGRKVRQARESAGMTQARLSEALVAAGAALTSSQVAKLERGERPTSIEELMALGKALEVDPAKLLDEREWNRMDTLWVTVERQRTELVARQKRIEAEQDQLNQEFEHVNYMIAKLLDEQQKSEGGSADAEQVD